jgi:uncharacterized protein YaeQ
VFVALKPTIYKFKITLADIDRISLWIDIGEPTFDRMKKATQLSPTLSFSCGTLIMATGTLVFRLVVGRDSFVKN